MSGLFVSGRSTVAMWCRCRGPIKCGTRWNGRGEGCSRAGDVTGVLSAGVSRGAQRVSAAVAPCEKRQGCCVPLSHCGDEEEAGRSNGMIRDL